MSLDLSATASKLLASLAASKDGDYISFKRTTGATLDPSDGSISGGTEVKTSVNGAVKSFDANLINGTTIKEGDSLVVIDNEYAPKLDDELLIGNVVHQIINIVEKNHAGIVQVYEVQARR